MCDHRGPPLICGSEKTSSGFVRIFYFFEMVKKIIKRSDTNYASNSRSVEMNLLKYTQHALKIEEDSYSRNP